MKASDCTLICNVRTMRLAKGMSQGQLADLIGVKRQAVYDIEIGKYTPNTALALRLAKYLCCTVEDLFVEEIGGEAQVNLVEPVQSDNVRVAIAKIRNKLMAYPLTGKQLLSLEGFEPADGIMSSTGNVAQLLCPASRLEQSVILYGCDPGFSLLAMHTMREIPFSRIHCLFASSRNALQKLHFGEAHLAGSHMHNYGTEDGNLRLIREVIPNLPVLVMAFAHIDEGMLVAPGNPLGLKSIADLGDGKARIVNRRPGAALRSLLDDHLARNGLISSSVVGYDQEASTHHEGALHVLYGKADVALGLRPFAQTYGLDFIPIETVRCDLVVPKDFLKLPEVSHIIEILQTRKIREELRSLPGYDSRDTGKVIAEL